MKVDHYGLTAVTAGQPFLTDTVFIIIYDMTTKKIEAALRDNRCVVLADDPWKWIRRDLFGDLVVVDVRHSDEPVRKATLSDKRNACIQGTTMPIKK